MPEIVILGIALEAVVVAVMALLLWLATPALVRFLNWSLGSLPIVGGAVAGVVTSGLQAASGAIYSWSQSQILPIARAGWSVTAVVWAYLVNTVNSIADAKNFGIYGIVAGQSAAGLASSLASAAENAAVGYTGALVGDLTVELENLAAGVSAQGAYVLGVALSDAENAQANAVGYAQALVGQATSQLLEVQSGLEGMITSSVASATNYLEGQIANVDLSLTALEQTLQAQVAQVGATALQEAVTAAQGAQTAAEAAIAAGLPDIVVGPWADLLPNLGTIVAHLPADVVAGLNLPGAIAGVQTGTVAGVLGGVVAAVGAIAAEEAECGVDLCTNLSGLSGLLGTIATDVFLAALVAWVAEAATDPTAAAADMRAVAGPLVSAAESTIRDLVGV